MQAAHTPELLKNPSAQAAKQVELVRTVGAMQLVHDEVEADVQP